MTQQRAPLWSNSSWLGYNWPLTLHGSRYSGLDVSASNAWRWWDQPDPALSIYQGWHSPSYQVRTPSPPPIQSQTSSLIYCLGHTECGPSLVLFTSPKWPLHMGVDPWTSDYRAHHQDTSIPTQPRGLSCQPKPLWPICSMGKNHICFSASSNAIVSLKRSCRSRGISSLSL